MNTLMKNHHIGSVIVIGKKWEKIIVIKGNYERMIKNIGARKMVKILESVETPCTLWGC